MSLTDQAAALFASRLQPSEHPGRAGVVAAIRSSLLTNGGTRGCAAVVAVEYGEHPETAAARMQWALRLASAAPAAMAA
ncbi:hypothetical protein [Krasilnikovia sp. MM14-A1259]|uniref:hypothetical protein n=1 Tax=Krasilnikovia sp. MM14-A1259 TaxID=3373539 RepID=UPI003812CF1D